MIDQIKYEVQEIMQLFCNYSMKDSTQSTARTQTLFNSAKIFI